MCKECNCGANATQQQIFQVPGMTCGNCVQAVEAALLKLPGVLAADVDLESKNVKVDFKGTEVTSDQIIAAIAATGFEVNKEAIVEKASSGVLGAVKNFFK